MLHRSLIGHIPDVCSMICAKLLAAALVIRARIISNTVLTWPFEDSLRSSVSPMDGGQSGGTFGTVIMNNNIHCDYANCHITSTAASHCLRQAFRSFVMVHPTRVGSHLSAGSYMYYDARSFAGPSSVMILHSMAPSAQLNYDVCSSTAPRPIASALILRRDTETFLT